MERMPCGQQEANAVFWRIGALAYNLFVLFKRQALPEAWRKHQVQTVRWRLYQTAGKVVTHAGALILKVRRVDVRSVRGGTNPMPRVGLPGTANAPQSLGTRKGRGAPAEGRKGSSRAEHRDSRLPEREKAEPLGH